MPDWTTLLTEEERADWNDLFRWADRQHLPREQMEPALDGSRGALARALRTVATLRALVEEKDGALEEARHTIRETAKVLIVVKPYPDRPSLSRFFERHEGIPWGLLNKSYPSIRAALALTEDEMRKRLEAK